MAKKNNKQNKKPKGKQFSNRRKVESDPENSSQEQDDSEEEVLNLGVDVSDDSDQDNRDDDEEEDDEEEDGDNDDDDDGGYYDDDSEDDDDDEEMQRLKHLLKVSKQQAGESGDEDDENEQGKLKGEKWGKKKSYYSGDTADLEIDQPFEDAEEEYEAAKEIYNKKLSTMKESDFLDDLESDGSEDFHGSKISSSIKKKDKVMGDLELVALGVGGDMNIQIEQINRDLSKLTKEQRKALVQSEAPELESILKDIQIKEIDLNDVVTPALAIVTKALETNPKAISPSVQQVLSLKQQILMTYMTNVVFYLYMKSMGEDVRNHPVMKQLLQLRYAMVKINILESKLKRSMQRVLEALTGHDTEEEAVQSLLDSAMNVDEDEDENEDDEDQGDEDEDDNDENENEDDDDIMENDSDIYKDTSDEDNNDDDEDSEIVDRKLKKSKKSSTGNHDDLDEEEARFTQLTSMGRSKKSHQSQDGVSKSVSFANRAHISDVGDFEAKDNVSKATKKSQSKAMDGLAKLASLFGNSKSTDSSSALQRAVNSMAQVDSKTAQKKKNQVTDEYMAPLPDKWALKPRRGKNDDDEDDNNNNDDDNDYGFQDYDTGFEKKRRRRAPDMDGDNDDDMDSGNNNKNNSNGTRLLDAFSSKKQKFLEKKKEHYTAEPRYGGWEEDVDEGEKRGINYQIKKNRGLTPHRKKENRNARVKKRNQYDRAKVRRKGQVQEVRTGVGSYYEGESGIKTGLSKSRRM